MKIHIPDFESVRPTEALDAESEGGWTFSLLFGEM